MIEGEVEINYWADDGTEAEEYPWGCSSLRPDPPFLVPANGLGKGLLGQPQPGSGGLCSVGLFHLPRVCPMLASPAPCQTGDTGTSKPPLLPRSGRLNPPSSSIACLGIEGCIPILNSVLNKPQSAPKIVAKWETGLIFSWLLSGCEFTTPRKPTKHHSCVACYFCLTGIC